MRLRAFDCSEFIAANLLGDLALPAHAQALPNISEEMQLTPGTVIVAGHLASNPPGQSHQVLESAGLRLTM